jgi:hypothetical protein
MFSLERIIIIALFSFGFLVAFCVYWDSTIDYPQQKQECESRGGRLLLIKNERICLAKDIVIDLE